MTAKTVQILDAITSTLWLASAAALLIAGRAHEAMPCVMAGVAHLRLALRPQV